MSIANQTTVFHPSFVMADVFGGTIYLPRGHDTSKNVLLAPTHEQVRATIHDYHRQYDAHAKPGIVSQVTNLRELRGAEFLQRIRELTTNVSHHISRLSGWQINGKNTIMKPYPEDEALKLLEEGALTPEEVAVGYMAQTNFMHLDSRGTNHQIIPRIDLHAQQASLRVVKGGLGVMMRNSGGLVQQEDYSLILNEKTFHQLFGPLSDETMGERLQKAARRVYEMHGVHYEIVSRGSEADHLLQKSDSDFKHWKLEKGLPKSLVAQASVTGDVLGTRKSLVEVNLIHAGQVFGKLYEVRVRNPHLVDGALKLVGRYTTLQGDDTHDFVVTPEGDVSQLIVQLFGITQGFGDASSVEATPH